MKAWTDHVWSEFNQKPTNPPTFSEVEILAFDGFSYCKVKIGDFVSQRELRISQLYNEVDKDGIRAKVTKGQLKPLKVVRTKDGHLPS